MSIPTPPSRFRALSLLRRTSRGITPRRRKLPTAHKSRALWLLLIRHLRIREIVRSHLRARLCEHDGRDRARSSRDLKTTQDPHAASAAQPAGLSEGKTKCAERRCEDKSEIVLKKPHTMPRARTPGETPDSVPTPRRIVLLPPTGTNARSATEKPLRQEAVPETRRESNTRVPPRSSGDLPPLGRPMETPIAKSPHTPSDAQGARLHAAPHDGSSIPRGGPGREILRRAPQLAPFHQRREGEE